jgi:hypothetical protein
MADSAIDVVNMALARLGEPPISAFDDGSEVGAVAERLYEPLIGRLLSMRPWHFAQAKVALLVDGAAPTLQGWERGFLLPALGSERIGHPSGFYLSGDPYAQRLDRYEVQGRWVFANVPTLRAEVVRRAPEAEWPAAFVLLAAEALAAELSLPVTENASREQLHRVNAFGSPGEANRGGYFREAAQADDAGGASQSLLDGTDWLTAARFGGYRRA